MERKKIDEVPVVDEKGRPIGLLDVQDILRAGLV
jgi:arabinose-5-phosphate isomerase